MRQPDEVDAEAFQPKYEKAAVIGLEPSAAFHQRLFHDCERLF